MTACKTFHSTNAIFAGLAVNFLAKVWIATATTTTTASAVATVAKASASVE